MLKINTRPRKKVHVKNEGNLNQLCTAYYKYLHKFKIIHLHYYYNIEVQLQIWGRSVVSDFLAAGADANKKFYTNADMVQYIGSRELKSRL